MRLRFSQLLCVALLAGAFLVMSDGQAQTKPGLASWYGPGFEGQLTASGETFNPHGFTAAHNTLPFGTTLNVSYGGRTVQVVVNDRGPYSGGRELDLSQGAAEYLGLTAAGVDYVDYNISGGGYGGGYGAGRPAYAEREYPVQRAATPAYSADERVAASGAYVVQSGDTLSGIAAELGTSVGALAAANGIEDPNLLYPGQTISY